MAIKFDPILGKLREKDVAEGGSATWGNVTGTLSNQTDLQSALDGKSSTSHNHDGVYAPVLGIDDNYVTDAEKTKLANLSGTNTGDQVIPDQLSDLSDDATHRLVTDTEKSTWNSKQDALGFTAVPTTRTVNGVNLSSNITLTQDDIGDGTTYKQYSSTEKTKLAGIATGAEVNVQADWNQVDSGADDYIKNKPSSFGLTQPQILARSLGA